MAASPKARGPEGEMKKRCERRSSAWLNVTPDEHIRLGEHALGRGL